MRIVPRPVARLLLAGLLLAGWLPRPLFAQSAPPPGGRLVRIAHQYAPGTLTEGDPRDRLCRAFAAEVEKRTKGSLRFEIKGENSFAPVEQTFDSLAKGSLEMSIIPLSYAQDKIPELGITLLPALVQSYDQAYRWRTSPIGADLAALLDKNGMKVVTWVWLAGGIASTTRPVLVPGDVRGLRMRGGGKEMDVMLSAAGATVVSLPSSKIYAEMKAGRVDGAVTPASSLLSYKLHEVSRMITTTRGKSFYFVLIPLLISKVTYESLTPEERRIVTEVGASLEATVRQNVAKDDEKLAEAYLRTNALVSDMDEEQFEQWRRLARAGSWRDFERKVPNGKAWIDKANAVP